MREPRSLFLPLLKDVQTTATFLSKQQTIANGLRVGELGFDMTDKTIFDLILRRDINSLVTINLITPSN